MQSLGS